MTFLVVALNRQAKTAKLTTLTLQPSLPAKFPQNWLLALPGGALITYPYKLRQFFLDLGVHVHPVHPLATPMSRTAVRDSHLQIAELKTVQRQFCRR